MKEHDTISGNPYFVTCKAGCVITDASGELKLTCEPGHQQFVNAPSDKLYTSEDAVVRKANFNYAPAALGLLGGGVSELPAGYIKAEFLESTSNGDSNVFSYFALPISAQSPEDSLEVETEHYLTKKPTVAQIEGLGENTGALNIGYSVTNDSGFISFDGVTDTGNVVADINLFFNYPLQRWTVLKISLTAKAIIQSTDGLIVNSYTPNWGTNNIRRTQIGCFGRISFEGYAPYGMCGRKRAYRLWVNQKKKYDLKPAVDNAGKPCFFNIVDGKTFYNQGVSYFVVGFTLPQARKLRFLSAGGGALTISLPSNWQEDAAVVDALATAEGKGWVLTIQTYEADAGAASTFALRRIWVRKRAEEYGSYVAADGSRWQIDWCATMVGGDPQDHGYELFRSVEAAAEYWELQPYVHPEDEQLLTD